MIRRMCPADAEQAAEIAAGSMPQPWSAQAFREEIKNDAALLLVSEDERTGILQGYISLQLTPDDAELTGIAVRVQLRRGGIAAALLAQARELLRAAGCTRIVLEVRTSNVPAISFYQKHGFTVIGIRGNFYDSPREDALVMQDMKEAFYD